MAQGAASPPPMSETQMEFQTSGLGPTQPWPPLAVSLLRHLQSDPCSSWHWLKLGNEIGRKGKWVVLPESGEGRHLWCRTGDLAEISRACTLGVASCLKSRQLPLKISYFLHAAGWHAWMVPPSSSLGGLKQQEL